MGGKGKKSREKGRIKRKERMWRKEKEVIGKEE